MTHQEMGVWFLFIFSVAHDLVHYLAMFFSGGSGGGSAAAGGQGRYTMLAGPAPYYGSLYLPREYGGNGGLGGGASVDSRCSPHVS